MPGESMDAKNPAHYLKLAYLAETAIVFNLAYIELSWKKQFNDLTDKMGNLSPTTLTFNRGTIDPASYTDQESQPPHSIT